MAPSDHFFGPIGGGAQRSCWVVIFANRVKKLLGTKGIAIRSKKLLGAPGLTTRSMLATRNKGQRH